MGRPVSRIVHAGSSQVGLLILSIFIMVMIVGGFVVLGIICWVFWRAWKRDLAMEEADRIREEAFSMPPERDRFEATPGRPDQAIASRREAD